MECESGLLELDPRAVGYVWMEIHEAGATQGMEGMVVKTVLEVRTDGPGVYRAMTYFRVLDWAAMSPVERIRFRRRMARSLNEKIVAAEGPVPE